MSVQGDEYPGGMSGGMSGVSIPEGGYVCGGDYPRGGVPLDMRPGLSTHPRRHGTLDQAYPRHTEETWNQAYPPLEGT